jgi:hypothetical protein
MRMQKDYESARKAAEEVYVSFGKIHCPALGNEPVHFTSEGFNHLIYKTAKKPRDERVQMMKFELLEKAKFIIETSTTFQEYEENFEYMAREKHGRMIKESYLVRCWGFVAIVNKSRVKVVVWQIGNGNKHFYSVIPAWFTKQYRGIKFIETATAGGLLVEDDNETLKNAADSDAL